MRSSSQSIFHDVDGIVGEMRSSLKMAVERIDGADDSRVAGYRNVRDGDLVRARGLFVAEGRLVVRRVIEDGRCRIASVLVNDAALSDLGQTLEALAADVPVLVCDAGALAGITGYDVHRGCLALVHRPMPQAIDDVVAAARTIVVLEGVTNADNVGGVFRNAAALGAQAVVLSPTCCDPLYRKAIRTSMGAALRVPFARADAGDWPGAVIRVRAAGFTLVALTPREPSETLETFAMRPRPSRIALIVGTEGAGLSAAAESAADYRVRIPIGGEVDSLNLAVATGVVLYRLSAR
jgi:tRNA G18 (ribose-2'-O)-methylase SpoU